ncbi:hypothetical protein ACFFHH_20180 [Cytobacillus solani]|uniref:hypothetical protein n=1 Tax=Cytobacillus solani TaxID=1637975 RepID=UPI00114F6F83|nr:hypothetical protein [Cytobacillus solani]
MSKKVLLFIFILILLASCSNNQQETLNEINNNQTNEEATLEEEIGKQRELTSEELELTELIINKKYDEVARECIGFENQTQKDFYKLASAFRVYQNYNKDTESVLPVSFESVIEDLDKITFIPPQLSKEVKNLRDWAIWKVNYFNKKAKQENSKGKIGIGMTQEEVIESIGKPTDINKTVTANGTSEQWVYPNYVYLYFEDGILTSYQK